jgi:hypothetical protein
MWSWWWAGHIPNIKHWAFITEHRTLNTISQLHNVDMDVKAECMVQMQPVCYM